MIRSRSRLRAAPALLGASLLLSACGEKPAPEAAPPPPVEAVAEAPPPAPEPPPAPPPPPAPIAPVAPPPTEPLGLPAGGPQLKVVLSGIVSGKPDAAVKTLVYLTREPCAPLPAAVTLLGKAEGNAEGVFGAVFPSPKGIMGHVCAVALDLEGRIAAMAVSTRNPIELDSAEGVVAIGELNLRLKEQAPAPLPKGI